MSKLTKKTKIAFFSFTSCEGCQFVLLDLGEKFFDLLRKCDLIDFSLIEQKPFPKRPKIDVAFVEGNPIKAKEIKLLKKIRKESKILVVLGNCAALGGIPEMKNYQNKEKTIRFIYKNLKDIENPEIKEIDNFVKVDFTIPGCPIDGKEFLKYVNDLIRGKIPKILEFPVCKECLHQGKESCFLRKKEPCLGVITLGGCEAVCTKNNQLCYGCRGILKNINPKGFLATIKNFKKPEEIEDNLEIFGVKDELEEMGAL